MQPQAIITHRLLLLTNPAEAETLRALLATRPLAEWEVLEAESQEHARFLQQWDPCDVILVDSSRMTEGDRTELTRLTFPRRTPLIVLVDAARTAHLHAGQVPEHWLPRQLVLEHPVALTTVLRQAAQFSQLNRILQYREEALQDSRRQVNRLVNLLWNTIPSETPAPWFTQRQMLERLHEEVTRCKRYGDDLSVVVGELAGNPGQPLDQIDPGQLTAWLATGLGQHKRRSDVAGQYGPVGFLLLLTQTNEEGAIQCCQRLRPLLQHVDSLPEGIRAVPRIRLGLAGFSPASTTVSSLLARAEERLDLARQQAVDCLVN